MTSNFSAGIRFSPSIFPVNDSSLIIILQFDLNQTVRFNSSLTKNKYNIKLCIIASRPTHGMPPKACVSCREGQKESGRCQESSRKAAEEDGDRATTSSLATKVSVADTTERCRAMQVLQQLPHHGDSQKNLHSARGLGLEPNTDGPFKF